MAIGGVTQPLRIVLGGNTMVHDDDGTLRSTGASQPRARVLCSVTLPANVRLRRTGPEKFGLPHVASANVRKVNRPLGQNWNRTPFTCTPQGE